MSKIAIFASGKGSNADRLMTYFKSSNEITVELLVTNIERAKVLDVAHKHKIESLVVSEEHLEKEKFIASLKEKEIEFIVLAGFLKKIPPCLIDSFTERIVNLHPSLLPKYGGKGMYGINVHRKVIENNEKVSGITVHLVNSEYDKGKVLAQFSCAVNELDSAETLAKKIQKLEHTHFPKVIENYVKSKILV